MPRYILADLKDDGSWRYIKSIKENRFFGVTHLDLEWTDRREEAARFDSARAAVGWAIEIGIPLKCEVE